MYDLSSFSALGITAEVPFNRLADHLCRRAYADIIEMSIPRGGLDVGMTQHARDHRQGLGALGRMAGEGMPQVMKAQARYAGLIADRIPERLEIGRADHLAVRHEQIGCRLVSRQAVDDRARLLAQPNRARPGLAVTSCKRRPLTLD